MSANGRKTGLSRPGVGALSLLAGMAVVLFGPSARAQLEESYQEQQVQTVEEREEAPRTTAREEIEAEPRAEARWFEETIGLEQIERMDAAMNRLRDLVRDAAPGSSQRADYMFRLAELYYKRARYFEQRAYERRDRAFEVRDTNPAQATQYERAADDDLEQSDRAATEAIELYVDIYENYHDSYPDMDGVLYYLGSTLSQLGRLEDALDFFEELVNDYPSSPYMPRALLAFGEYYFLIAGDMREAQMFYQAVTEFPDSEVYPYALYQEAWCFYNLQEYPEAIQRLLDTIDASTGESAGRIRMRRRALHDLALFYSEVGTADNAFEFFEAVPEITEDKVFELVELVARLYGEDGNYRESNALYRELMARNRDSFKVVGYQREIVRNTLPSGDEEAIVREVRRWVELFTAARNFEDATPEAVAEAGDVIEYEVRRLATTYHRDAQVTNNARLYAMAYNLYGDYVTDLAEWADPETRYTMTFYYAELLYRNGNYAEAAAMWEQCLEIDPDGEYNEEAIYKAVLAYTRLVEMEGEMDVERANLQTSEEGDIQTEGAIPVPLELPDVMQRLVRAADRYLELNPPPEFAVEVEFAAARVLYEYAHLSEAAQRFGQIATTYTDVDPERAQVSAELLLDCLYTLNDVEGMERWVERLRDSDLNRGAFAVRLNQLGTQISFSNCRQIQLAEDYEQCGLCFFDFFREYHDSDLVDRALYNSALCFDEADMIAQSIRVREYLIQYRPESPLVPEIRFGLGQAFHRLALYRDASEYYEEYAREHPDEEHAADALGSAATFRQGLGEFDEAIADYEAYIDLFRRDREEEAATAFFQIGVIYEDRGQTDEAIRQFERYLDRWADRGRPGLAIEAATRIGRMRWENDPEEAEDWFVQALDSYNAMTDEERADLEPSALDAAAEARFMLGEFVFQRFTQVEIAGNETQVQERLREKLDIGREASTVYEQVQAFQRPGWSIAAFTRLGQLYHEFYEAVINAPVPEGMPFEVEEAYRAMLVEQSEAVRDQAITNYQTALRIARTAGWFNEYSVLAERQLAELDPSFRAGNEVRANPGYEPTEFFQSAYLMTPEEEENEAEEPPAEEAPEPVADDEVPQVSEANP